MIGPRPDLQEPEGTRAELRRLAGEDPAGSRAVIAARLSERLWPALSAELAGAGATPALLSAVLSELSYESWLWVMGDRTWEHLADGLLGRLRRRLPGLGEQGSATAAS